MKQSTKKLEKFIKDSQKEYKRPYAFVSETKLGTIGTWLTNGHFAYIANTDSDMVKLANIDKQLLDGQQILIAMDNLSGYTQVSSSNTLQEVRTKYKYERILEIQDIEPNDGYQILLNNQYFEAIREAFPNAVMYTKDARSPVLWIDETEKRLVAICMPLRGK